MFAERRDYCAELKSSVLCQNLVPYSLYFVTLKD